MTDMPKLAFISAKLTRNSRPRKTEPGRKPEHTEALLENEALQLELFKEENGNKETNSTNSN